MVSFSIAGQDRQQLVVTVFKYEQDFSSEYYDDNWLVVSVRLRVGQFSAEFDAAFLTQEIVDFKNELQKLYDTLKGMARFSTIEGQVSLEVVVNDCGNMIVSGVVVDNLSLGNKLEFSFQSDQTYLKTALKEIDEVVSRFPVRIVR